MNGNSEREAGPPKRRKIRGHPVVALHDQSERKEVGTSPFELFEILGIYEEVQGQTTAAMELTDIVDSCIQDPNISSSSREVDNELAARSPSGLQLKKKIINYKAHIDRIKIDLERIRKEEEDQISKVKRRFAQIIADKKREIVNVRAKWQSTQLKLEMESPKS